MAPPRPTGKKSKKGKKGGKPEKPTRYEDFEKEAAPERSTTSGAARRAAAKARMLAKPPPKRLAKNYTDVRAKGRAGKAQSSTQASVRSKDKHAKTKHEFIQRKKAEALAQFKEEKQLAKAETQQPRPTVNPADVPALAVASEQPTREFVTVTGSYERLLYGLRGAASRSDQGKVAVDFNPIFMFPAHISSIRTAACAGTGSRWLATGGNDEAIKVWDLKKRVEVGSLTGHSGTITSVHFPSKGYLITSSEDGLINVYRAREWSLLVTLKGHKGAVHDVATHPSGKVALSVGKDRTVRMWDLMRGKPAASTKIPASADKVAWDTQGARFAVASGPTMRVYDTAMNLVGEVQTRVRWHDVLFYSFQDEQGNAHEALLAAGEDKMVHVLDVEHPFEEEGLPTFREVARLTGHGNRVKAASIVPAIVDDDVVPICMTASSDGSVRAFDLSSVGDLLASSPSEPAEITSVGQYSTKGTRLTCLSTTGVLEEAKPNRKGKGKEVQIDEGDEEADEEMLDADSDVDSDGDVDTEAEEAELQELEKQIEQAKKEGLLEEYSSGDDDEDDDDDEGDDDEGSEAESAEEVESELEEEPEEESD